MYSFEINVHSVRPLGMGPVMIFICLCVSLSVPLHLIEPGPLGTKILTQTTRCPNINLDHQVPKYKPIPLGTQQFTVTKGYPNISLNHYVSTYYSGPLGIKILAWTTRFPNISLDHQAAIYQTGPLDIQVFVSTNISLDRQVPKDYFRPLGTLCQHLTTRCPLPDLDYHLNIVLYA